MTLYSVLVIVLSALFRIFFRMKVHGIENIPRSGGVVIASNHISVLDPPILGVAASRTLHFMAKRELFANTFFGWLIAKLNAFPVQRGAPDRVAIRKALSLLEQGEVLGIFPEGTRSKNGILGTAEPGVAMIAAKAGVPIIPAAIFGANQIGKTGLLPPKFSVIFGTPIMPEAGRVDRIAIDQLSDEMMKAIACLVDKR